MTTFCLHLGLFSLIIEGLFVYFQDFSIFFCLVFMVCFVYFYGYKNKEDRRRAYIKSGYRLIEFSEAAYAYGLSILALTTIGVLLVVFLRDILDNNGSESMINHLIIFIILCLTDLFGFIFGKYIYYPLFETKKIKAFKEEAKKIIKEDEKKEKDAYARMVREERKQTREQENEKRLKETKESNFQYFKNYQQYIITITNSIRSLNPNAIEAQKKVLTDNYTEKVLEWYYKIDQLAYNQTDYDKSCEIISKWEISPKREFVRILFKLVVCDDGIKNDEWYALQNLMVKLKLNTSSIKYLNRIYEPLRTERDYYEQQQETYTQTTYQSGLSAYYAVLGLTESATKAEVQDAYHKLALLYHPDLPKNANRKQECEAMMAKINEAYEVIGSRY